MDNKTSIVLDITYVKLNKDVKGKPLKWVNILQEELIKLRECEQGQWTRNMLCYSVAKSRTAAGQCRTSV